MWSISLGVVMRRESQIVDGMKCWVCSTCHNVLPESDFYKDDRRKTGFKSQCKKCHCRTTIDSRDQDLHRERNRKWMNKYSKREYVKVKERIRSSNRRLSLEVICRSIANAAIRSGRLVRPPVCSNCKSGKPQAHHDDYYDPMNVQWLCSRCHATLHRIRNNQTKEDK